MRGPLSAVANKDKEQDGNQSDRRVVKGKQRHHRLPDRLMLVEQHCVSKSPAPYILNNSAKK